MTYTGSSRLADFVRGLTALVVFLFFLVGCPVAMSAMGGSPIPNRIPSWEEISATLMRQDTDQSVFLATLFLIGWGAWCLFIITVCSEAVNYLAGRSRSAAPRPVRPLQELVRNLVATATLTFSAVASSAPRPPPPPRRTRTLLPPMPIPPLFQKRAHAPRQDTPPQEPTESEWTPLLADEPAAQPKPDHHEARTHVVKRGETLCGLAQRTYGSGDRYPEIFENSRKIDQPDGIPLSPTPTSSTQASAYGSHAPACQTPHLRLRGRPPRRQVRTHPQLSRTIKAVPEPQLHVVQRPARRRRHRC